MPNVHLTNATLIVQVLQWHENSLDFADALHLSQSQSCSVLYTFDTKFANRAKGRTKCKV